MFNPYQVILINPDRYPTIKYQDAKAFSDWLVTNKGQDLINGFRLNGKQLFVANAKDAK
ncbi:ABC-type tungstate transport system [Vibrio sp. JCM 19236]|nr:ABC-type tungstate transport system [Vibrio sp. JCM 19236]